MPKVLVRMAGALSSGLVSLAAQAFAGAKTFSSSITFTGAATPITRLIRVTVSITPAAVSANTTSSQTFTIGAGSVGDMIAGVNPPSSVDGLGITFVRQNSSGVAQIRWQNVTGGSLTPPAGDYIFFLVRVV